VYLSVQLQLLRIRDVWNVSDVIRRLMSPTTTEFGVPYSKADDDVVSFSVDVSSV